MCAAYSLLTQLLEYELEEQLTKREQLYSVPLSHICCGPVRSLHASRLTRKLADYVRGLMEFAAIRDSLNSRVAVLQNHTVPLNEAVGEDRRVGTFRECRLFPETLSGLRRG